MATPHSTLSHWNWASSHTIVQQLPRAIQGTGAGMVERHHMDNDPQAWLIRDIGHHRATLSVDGVTPHRKSNDQHDESEEYRLESHVFCTGSRDRFSPSKSRLPSVC